MVKREEKRLCGCLVNRRWLPLIDDSRLVGHSFFDSSPRNFNATCIVRNSPLTFRVRWLFRDENLIIEDLTFETRNFLDG